MKKIIRCVERILRQQPPVMPPERIVSCYFFFMWNHWSKDECDAIFGWLTDHIWAKWVYHHGKIGSFGAAERLYSELDCGNRKLIVDRACDKYKNLPL